MRINQINSIFSFGKTPVMKCEVKRKEDNKRVNSTLYSLDVTLPSDLDELRSKTSYYMFKEMKKERAGKNQFREYYVLKDDKTNEIISCAMTSHRYRIGTDKDSGYYTLIEEMGYKDKYVNPQEPLFAYLAQRAFDRYDKSLRIGYYTEETAPVKHAGFKQKDNGEWLLSERRYSDLIDKALKRNNITLINTK